MKLISLEKNVFFCLFLSQVLFVCVYVQMGRGSHGGQKRVWIFSELGLQEASTVMCTGTQTVLCRKIGVLTPTSIAFFSQSFLLLFFFFFMTGSLYRSGCPGTHNVDHAACSSQRWRRVLGLKLSATMPNCFLGSKEA